MALLLGWQWWVTIYLLVSFFSIIGGMSYAVWSISHRRRRPPSDLTPGSRGPVDEPKVG